MQESEFIKHCENTLIKLLDQIEKLDSSMRLDVEYSDGVLSIVDESSGKTYIINRNAASRKIWYSSPISGADYFSYDELQDKWFDDKKIELTQKLFGELF